MRPAALLRNPVVEAVVYEVCGQVVRIDMSSFSTVRGVLKSSLLKGQSSTLEAALHLLGHAKTRELKVAGLPAEVTLALWRAGLLITPQERADVTDDAFSLWKRDWPISPDEDGNGCAPDRSASRSDYARHGLALIPECVTPAAVTALVAHYRALIDRGLMRRGDSQADRYVALNDPAVRLVQRALLNTVGTIVDRPIKASRAYTSLYCGGTTLPKHIDLPQCEYTVSLLIDYRPWPADGRSPWPVQVFTVPDAPPVELFQSIGGGILFRGHRMPHARPALPPENACWVMLLHYVDSDYSGSLD